MPLNVFEKRTRCSSSAGAHCDENDHLPRKATPPRRPGANKPLVKTPANSRSCQRTSTRADRTKRTPSGNDAASSKQLRSQYFQPRPVNVRPGHGTEPALLNGQQSRQQSQLAHFAKWHAMLATDLQGHASTASTACTGLQWHIARPLQHAQTAQSDR